MKTRTHTKWWSNYKDCIGKVWHTQGMNRLLQDTSTIDNSAVQNCSFLLLLYLPSWNYFLQAKLNGNRKKSTTDVENIIESCISVLPIILGSMYCVANHICDHPVIVKRPRADFTYQEERRTFSEYNMGMHPFQIPCMTNNSRIVEAFLW